MSNPNSFQTVLNKFRKISFSERDKGTRFERLMQLYLKTDPKYAPIFEYVWLWNEFPLRLLAHPYPNERLTPALASWLVEPYPFVPLFVPPS